MLLTSFIAQFFGLMFLIISVTLSYRKSWTLDVIDAFIHDKALIFFGGAINLAAGLIMVLSHNIWTGGLLPVVVTLLGWLLLLRGILFLSLPTRKFERIYRSLNMKKNYNVFVVVAFILGLYLAMAGF